MHLQFLFFITFLFSCQIVSADEAIVIPIVIIEQNASNLESPLMGQEIFKVEKVSQKKIKAPTRQTLTDVVRDQQGVDSQVYCANCGAKRLTINGLKGEHTSILIDGLPLHSAVSSFYGVDSIPTNGIADILVMRGAGASLVNPEAIGGTLNLITVDPLNAKNSYAVSAGVDDSGTGKSQNHSFLYGIKNHKENFASLLGGQFTVAEPWDVDKNKISEFPLRQNYSLLSKTRLLDGSKNDWGARFSLSQLEILGGHWKPSKPHRVRPQPAQEDDFEDGNVERTYLGDPAKITDWVKINRAEAALTGTHYLKNATTLDWKLGLARQEQQAIYQHGFDYANVDMMFVGDTQLKIISGENAIFTVGAFFKDQRLRSASEVLFEKYPESDLRDIKKDSFDFASYALYAQYSFFLKEVLEVDLAWRADYIDLHWRELDNSIQTPVLAPRFQLLHHINHHLTQRTSYGLGYRAPLTFFESQHGNNEGGYEVDISDLEKAHSVVYSLSWNHPTYYITASSHYTHLQNMAFGFESFNQPILYRNSKESYDIWVSDFLTGFKPLNWWLIEASLEFFQYEDGYKAKLPTAAIEKRIQFRSNIEKGPWSHSLAVNLIGSRDLSKYGSYSVHYVNRNQASEPDLDPNLDKKNQKAPTHATVDTSLSYRMRNSLTFTFSVNNIFNYTQAGVGDNPSSWHWHFNHAHFDGLHTWGPNTGRQYFFSLSGEI